MTDKPNFKRVDNLATHILLSQPSFNSLKIDVAKLQFDYDIHFDSMQNYCELTGVSWDLMGFDSVRNGHTVKIDGGMHLVLYNANHTPERINWTIGHEIGHIYCGHKDDGKIAEIETNCFAAQLITPESLIRKLAHEFGFLDFGWIYNNFFVSLQSALKRVSTLSKKYYVKDHIAAMVINQFANPLKNSVDSFWKNPLQFNADLAYAHYLFDEYASEYKESYIFPCAVKGEKFFTH